MHWKKFTPRHEKKAGKPMGNYTGFLSWYYSAEWAQAKSQNPVDLSDNPCFVPKQANCWFSRIDNLLADRLLYWLSSVLL